MASFLKRLSGAVPFGQLWADAAAFASERRFEDAKRAMLKAQDAIGEAIPSGLASTETAVLAACILYGTGEVEQARACASHALERLPERGNLDESKFVTAALMRIARANGDTQTEDMIAHSPFGAEDFANISLAGIRPDLRRLIQFVP